MPSSADRRRVELPAYLYDRLKQIATTEDRTVASVLGEMVTAGLTTYQPKWIPSQSLDRFTQRARQVLDRAQQEEPHRFNHNWAGTEHLLLGLLREPNTLAAKTLTPYGVTPAAVTRMIDFMIGRGDRPVTGPVDYPPRARSALGYAAEEAQRLGHDFVGTGHILLGVLNEREGMGRRILGRIVGKHAEIFPQIRDRVLQELARSDLIPADA